MLKYIMHHRMAIVSKCLGRSSLSLNKRNEIATNCTCKNAANNILFNPHSIGLIDYIPQTMQT